SGGNGGRNESLSGYGKIDLAALQSEVSAKLANKTAINDGNIKEVIWTLSDYADSDDYTLLSAGVEGNEPQPVALNKFTKPLTARPLFAKPFSATPLSSSLQNTDACDRSGSVSGDVTTTYYTLVYNNCVDYDGFYRHGTLNLVFDKAFSSVEELIDALNNDKVLDRVGGFKFSSNSSSSDRDGYSYGRAKLYYHLERKSDRDIKGDYNEISYCSGTECYYSYTAISNATITLKNDGTKDSSGKYGANATGNNIVADITATGLTGTGSSCYSGGAATITGSSGVIEITYGSTITVKLNGINKFSGNCSAYRSWVNSF
ncbi:MAG: hypothetical protein LBU73_05085, partial [Helicobacteraceae bacterium]|nr:hypothetical protein [Helicobacteraceae bacterium]